MLAGRIDVQVAVAKGIVALAIRGSLTVPRGRRISTVLQDLKGLVNFPDQAALQDQSSATAPAVCGLAIEVPLLLPQPLPGIVE